MNVERCSSQSLTDRARFCCLFFIMARWGNNPIGKTPLRVTVISSDQQFESRYLYTDLYSQALECHPLFSCYPPMNWIAQERNEHERFQ